MLIFKPKSRRDCKVPEFPVYTEHRQDNLPSLDLAKTVTSLEPTFVTETTDSGCSCLSTVFVRTLRR